MQTINDCYDRGKKLPDITGELVALPDHHDPKTNILAMQFALRWFIEYLGIADGPTSQVMRQAGNIFEDHRRRAPQATFGQGNYESDWFALHCLADVHGTAALAREIIFQKAPHPREPRQHISVDLGTGTGVLMGASLIRGLRQGATNVSGYAFDSQAASIAGATRMLKQISGTHVEVYRADITDSETYELFRTSKGKKGGMGHALVEQDGQPIDAVVSETIAVHTPAMMTNRKGEVLTHWLQEMIFSAIAGQIDPFHTVMRKLASLPGFIKGVKKGRISLFPDIVNGDYLPTGQEGYLRMHTGPHQEHVELSKIADELREQYRCSFGSHRWG